VTRQVADRPVARALRRLLGRSEPRRSDVLAAEVLRRGCRRRFHTYRMLLNARTRVFTVVQELDRALGGSWPFDAAFVHTQCARASAGALRMIVHLNELTGGMHRTLLDRHRVIHNELMALVGKAPDRDLGAGAILDGRACPMDRAVCMSGPEGADSAEAGQPSPDAAMGSTLGRSLGPDARRRLLANPACALLAACAAHITPLTMDEPESLLFTPDNCRTFRDLASYCHQKAREAIVELCGRGGPGMGSKQLVFRGKAMQFWAVDLADGFSGAVLGPRVGFDNVVAEPAHALWRGMMSVPWEGPRVDARGFLAVLAQAACNHEIEPATSDGFAMRNLFLLARDYVNLECRFGFHFVCVEALAGDRPLENFLSFRFLGGAADMRRKVMRARFVENILARYGFVCEVVGDRMTARRQHGGREPMLRLLEVLGYLLMHTRQLDMIMGNETVMAEYHDRIMYDLREKVGMPPGW
jgi:hypothetical protein